MSDSEIRVWCTMLGRTIPQRRSVVSELLRNANSDDMSMDDRVACRRALEFLEREERRERSVYRRAS